MSNTTTPMTPRRGRPPAPPALFEIPALELLIDGAPFDTTDSRVAFARLMQAASDAERITFASIGGRHLDRDALGALNSFIRGGRAVGRNYRHPWHRRAGRVSYYTKHDWRELIDHLGLLTPAP